MDKEIAKHAQKKGGERKTRKTLTMLTTIEKLTKKNL